MRVAISGASGFVGRALVHFFEARGAHVTRIVRSYGNIPPDQATVVWHPQNGTIERAGLEGQDVIIHLAGESIAGVWTRAKRRRIRESRELGTTLLARTLSQLEQKPRAFFSASAMGFYGTRPELVDESAGPGAGFLAEVAQIWEDATLPARDAGIHTVIMRISNVLHPEGGLLQVMIPLCRLGLGARFGDGEQPWPWIARDDVGPAIAHLLEHPEVEGPVNFVAPDPTTNARFTNVLAGAVGRRNFLAVPGFAAKLAPGGMADELLLGGAAMVPRRLLESGYRFRWPELKPALTAMLAGRE